ncbi:MAG: hypothetical protein M3O70_17010 [Actinomycetota bacterium]|nr:hypothetical protein [Actinomycetota bacterium]
MMLTGNIPPALVTTHSYYEQRRWRRLVGEDIVARHNEMHGGTAPTTAQPWTEEDWPTTSPMQSGVNA